MYHLMMKYELRISDTFLQQKRAQFKVIFQS